MDADEIIASKPYNSHTRNSKHKTLKDYFGFCFKFENPLFSLNPSRVFFLLCNTRDSPTFKYINRQIRGSPNKSSLFLKPAASTRSSSSSTSTSLMAPVLSRSLATSASLISLSSSIRHPNNKVFNLRSVFLPQNNGLRKGFSCSGLKWKPEKRSDQVSIRCKAAVAEKESTDTSGEKFEYQAEVGFVLFCETWNLFEVLRIGS